MLPGISRLTILVDIPTGCLECALNPNINLHLMAPEAHEAIVTVQGGART